MSNLVDREAVRRGWGASKRPWFESRLVSVELVLLCFGVCLVSTNRLSYKCVPPSLKLSLQSLPSITNFGPNRVVFILGGTMNTSLQRQVEDEASQFGDIVQVNDIADIVNCF